MTSYAEALCWLLNTYVRDNVLSEAYSSVTRIMQGLAESETQFGTRLRTEAR